MPARTGADYLARLRENPGEIHLRGERVVDATAHPALRNGAHTLAKLYDLQHDPKFKDEMTYPSPTTGDPVGLSFIMPRTAEDLAKRGRMITNWARVTKGMMGRTPDFLNVALMSMAAAGGLLRQEPARVQGQRGQLL